jgi:DNA-binding XRE family transcriptional regulator
MVSAAQLRAARGLLDWTRADLAKAADVSPETIKNIEHGTFRPQEATTDAIIRAFSAHSVLFSDNDGVYKKRDNVRVLNGVDGFKKFMDDVHDEALKESANLEKNLPICVSGVDERLFVKYLGEYSPFHTDRMNKIEGIQIRVIISYDDAYKIGNSKYISYHRSNAKLNETVPFYVYGNKLAILTFQDEPQITIIDSLQVAKAYRQSFEVLWNVALPIE